MIPDLPDHDCFEDGTFSDEPWALATIAVFFLAFLGACAAGLSLVWGWW